MPDEPFAYYRRREAQERRLAEAADDPAVKRAHHALAGHYQHIVETGELPPSHGRGPFNLDRLLRTDRDVQRARP